MGLKQMPIANSLSLENHYLQSGQLESRFYIDIRSLGYWYNLIFMRLTELKVKTGVI